MTPADSARDRILDDSAIVLRMVRAEVCGLLPSRTAEHGAPAAAGDLGSLRSGTVYRQSIPD